MKLMISFLPCQRLGGVPGDLHLSLEFIDSKHCTSYISVQVGKNMREEWKNENIPLFLTFSTTFFVAFLSHCLV